MSIVKLRLELDLPALHDNALHGEVIFCFLYNTSQDFEKEICPHPTQNIILYYTSVPSSFSQPNKT